MSPLAPRRPPQPQLWPHDGCSSATGTGKGHNLQGKRNMRLFRSQNRQTIKGTSSSMWTTQMPWSCPRLLDSVGLAGGGGGWASQLLGQWFSNCAALRFRVMRERENTRCPGLTPDHEIRATGYGTQAWGLLKELQVVPIHRQGGHSQAYILCKSGKFGK